MTEKHPVSPSPPGVLRNGERLSRHVQLVSGVLADIDAIWNPSTSTFLWKSQEYTFDSMVLRVRAALSKKRRIPKDDVRTALEDLVNTLRQAEIERTAASLAAYDPHLGDLEVRKFVGLMKWLDPKDVSDLDVLAIQSLLWQVKRKFSGHTKVEYPLCVIFTGGQGFGKSWTLPRLFEPVKEWMAGGMPLKALNNEFNMIAFNQFFVVPFEEMGQRGNFDVEILKNIITEPFINYRPPRATRALKLANNATCYGTANHAASNLIADSTGARRWWEIAVVNREWDDEAKAQLEDIDFKALWMSVDGSTEANPRRGRVHDMSDVQRATVRHEGFLEEFFRECVERTEDPEERIPQDELHEAAATWFQRQGLRPPLKRQLREEATRLGIAIVSPCNRTHFVGIRLASPA